jgi:hypothetical protein
MGFRRSQEKGLKNAARTHRQLHALFGGFYPSLF